MRLDTELTVSDRGDRRKQSGEEGPAAREIVTQSDIATSAVTGPVIPDASRLDDALTLTLLWALF